MASLKRSVSRRLIGSRSIMGRLYRATLRGRVHPTGDAEVYFVAMIELAWAIDMAQVTPTGRATIGKKLSQHSRGLLTDRELGHALLEAILGVDTVGPVTPMTPTVGVGY